MKVKINGVEFEGTPEEINELINLHGYKICWKMIY